MKTDSVSPAGSRPSSMNPSEFDSYAADYDTELNKGLKFTGEDKYYFAEQRIVHVARCLARLGFAARNVLDFGCGTGTATPYFFEHVKASRTVGVDISAESLKIAQERYRDRAAEFVELSRYEARGEIDLAFCNGVFHHIVPPERPGALAIVRAALRPGGIFALWENSPWNPIVLWMMSRVEFDRDAIMLTPPGARRMLREAGFRVLLTDFKFIFPKPLSLLRPLEQPLRKLPLGGQYLVLCEKA